MASSLWQRLDFIFNLYAMSKVFGLLKRWMRRYVRKKIETIEIKEGIVLCCSDLMYVWYVLQLSRWAHNINVNFSCFHLFRLPIVI